MEACLKMTNVKLELLTDIGMVLMFEKEIRGGDYHKQYIDMHQQITNTCQTTIKITFHRTFNI